MSSVGQEHQGEKGIADLPAAAAAHDGGQPPLQGIRIIELANVISGPSAGMVLCDFGADVLKVELPEVGDPFRRWDARNRASSDAFNSFNRGKRSVAIDLRTEEGRAAVLALIASADVVIENFRPGFLISIGLGYEDAIKSNPAIIYCSIVGMSSADSRPVYDAIAQARSGLWSQFTDMQQPTAIGPALADPLAGMQCALGVLAGLVQRTRTGQGCHLEVSMLGACLSIQAISFGTYFATGTVPDRLSRVRASQSYGFVCSDDLPVAIHLSSVEKFWVNLVEALDARALFEDARFGSRGSRSDHYEELHRALSEVFRTQPRDVWLERLAKADVPAAPILTVAEAADDELVRSLGMFHEYGVDDRSFRGVGSAVSGFPSPDFSRPVPWVGEHTEEVLGQLKLGIRTSERL